MRITSDMVLRELAPGPSLEVLKWSNSRGFARLEIGYIFLTAAVPALSGITIKCSALSAKNSSIAVRVPGQCPDA
jgi:hypothetical protein